ncbi:MAG: class I SAM-dependent methyltransferase [Clostridia bacterium]|nr:class I SAM-dependent methyltransferase [Clostridia bacterium]
MDRIDILCSYLEGCKTFADVGCDHGYCTLYMLKNGLCESAVISDVSAKCLQKAETLLKNYIKEGKAASVCCDGLEKISADTDEVLIAGMGGDEIVSILKKSFIPKKFVFQPMKNSRAVREYLLLNGAGIITDEIFESYGKFYSVIKGTRKGNTVKYSEAQLEYGLALEGESAQRFLKSELDKKLGYLERPLGSADRAEIEKKVNLIRGVLKDER